MSVASERSRSKVFKGDKPAEGGAAPDVEQAMANVEAAADAVTHAAEASPKAQPAAPPARLQEIDSELAAQSDEILESSFASVEDVLGGSFNLGDDETAGRAPSTFAHSESETTATDAVESPSEPEPVVAHDAPDRDTGAEVGNASESASAPMNDSAPAAEQPVPPSRTDEVQADSSTPVARPTEPRRSTRGKVTGLVRVLKAAFRRGLELLARPLGLIPERHRSLVDWIALSLVFWVPVVWIVVFVLTGR